MLNRILLLLVCLFAQGDQPRAISDSRADLDRDRPASPSNIGAKGASSLESLLQTRPLEFLAKCVEKYDRDVIGYSVIFRKFEKGKTRGMEKIQCYFREKPFSVLMLWLENPGLTNKALYVEGENDNQLLAPLPFLGVKRFNVNDALAKSSSRYMIDEFGLKKATLRSVAGMKQAQERGKLFLEYKGLVEVPELNRRACYKFVRAPYDPPEEEGINEFTFYIDRETLLQTGSILKDSKGQLIAEYYFTDIQLNPEFKADLFTIKSLK